MPHSSGGGSHSGGSSSSSSSSSSYSGSSGGSSYVRTSHDYFNGAHTFVRYRNGQPEYLYSENKRLNQKASPFRFLLILAYLPFFFAIGSLGKVAIHYPTRLPLSYNTAIYVEDHLNVVEDEKRLVTDLEDFLDETGISVSLLTTSNQAWQENYNSLETYAYEQYVTRFPDESHWLIVYTSDKGEGYINNFEDWYFEGMQGNDTDGILTSRVTSHFNDMMTKYLLQGYSVDRSLEKALADIKSQGLMKLSVQWPAAIFALIVIAYLTGHMYMMLRDPNKKYRDYVLVSKDDKEVVCEYCGTTYYPGAVTKCPNCGAPKRKATEK